MNKFNITLSNYVLERVKQLKYSEIVNEKNETIDWDKILTVVFGSIAEAFKKEFYNEETNN